VHTQIHDELVVHVNNGLISFEVAKQAIGDVLLLF
jgi:hypothetical protein